MSKTGRPKLDTHPVTLRLSRNMIEAVDEYRRIQDDLPTRPEAIRRILFDYLGREGFLAGD